MNWDGSVSRYWHKLRRFFLQKMLHADDTPHRIALGVALATLVAFLPLIGFQTVIALGLAALLRANKAVCIPIVWITNPFTFVPIYWVCGRLGRVIMSSASADDPSAKLAGLATVEMHVLEYEFWSNLFHLFANLSRDLWVGCAIVGVGLGLPSYFITRSFVTHYRHLRAERLEKSRLRRGKAAASRTKMVGCEL